MSVIDYQHQLLTGLAWFRVKYVEIKLNMPAVKCRCRLPFHKQRVWAQA